MGENSNSVESMISNIVTVVFRIHFYYVKDKDLEEDLKQEGFLKAYELLATGNYDPTRNLRTFIYTGVRNAMTNYMYHIRKESHTDLDSVNSSINQDSVQILKVSDGYYQGKLFCYLEDDTNTAPPNINIDLVNSICNKYLDLGDYKPVVYSQLKKLGLCNITLKSNNIEVDDFLLNSILGEIFWKMFRNNK